MIRSLILLFSLTLCASVTKAQHPPYWEEIQAFKQKDSIHFPSAKAILFVGSSSFRLWSDIEKDFPKHVIINRGFGGSTLVDVIRYANDVIFPYHSKQIVLYCGENDLASSDSTTAQTVSDRFATLFKMIREKDSTVTITFVSIKPSPSRQKIQHKVVEANKMIEVFLKTKKNTAFVNVYDLMIDATGQPVKALFQTDMLHMKAEGYAIWTKAIAPYLLK